VDTLSDTGVAQTVIHREADAIETLQLACLSRTEVVGDLFKLYGVS
jgi:hypothetical protein